MESKQQPERGPLDGQISVIRKHFSEDTFILSCTHDGTDQSMTIGIYNAWRLFGMLAFMLGIKLPAKLLKGIKL